MPFSNASATREWRAANAAWRGNNEWPVVRTAVAKNPTLESLGKFKAENISVSEHFDRNDRKNQIAVQKVLDSVGCKLRSSMSPGFALATRHTAYSSLNANSLRRKLHGKSAPLLRLGIDHQDRVMP